MTDISWKCLNQYFLDILEPNIYQLVLKQEKSIKIHQKKFLDYKENMLPKNIYALMETIYAFVHMHTYVHADGECGLWSHTEIQW